MGEVLVSGLINIETTLRVESFPIYYSPVHYPFFGIDTTVSGVGYNISKALTLLGDSVHFVSMIGQDFAGRQVLEALENTAIGVSHVLANLPRTPQSVILYDNDGTRQINVDLKDIQEQSYPLEKFEAALDSCSLAVLCNINFSRPFLRKALQSGILIATDVHTVSNLDDEYNRDFMAAANVLFMSDENLPCTPVEWVHRVQNRYPAEVIVVGLGSRGAVLAVRQDRFVERIPAVYTRPVVNSIGAGDALFSCFVHFYRETREPYEAMKKAMVYASYKIGESGAADGLLDEASINQLYTDKKHLFK